MAEKNRRKQKKEKTNDPVYGIDYDDYHAQIMGFTSGGAAYGITWEEAKNMDKNREAENEEDWMNSILEATSNEEDVDEFKEMNKEDDEDDELPF
jgi:hypothetical protein